MKKMLFFITVSVFLSVSPSMGQKQPIQKDLIKLNAKIDSLEKMVNSLVYDQQKCSDSQLAIANRLIEVREDYTNLLNDSHETRNWLLGIVSLIVGAFGVAFPLFSNRGAKKKSDKAEQRVLQLHQSIEDIKKRLLMSEKNMKEVAVQVNKDRGVVQGQMEGIKKIKQQVDNMQTKIETSERNARESQKAAMINRLFAQAANEKNPNTVIDLLTKILRLEQNVTAYIQRANQYLECKLYHEAILDAKKVIDLKSEDKSDIAYANYILAVANANLNIYDQALQYINEGIKILPNVAEGYKIRASIYAHQERPQDTIADLYTAASFTKLNANDYNELAYSHYKLGKFDIALSNITESLKRNPNFAEALDTRGCIYMELGEQYYISALEDFNQALKLNPQLWESYENRKCLYDKMMAIETDPQKIKDLQRLRDNDMEAFAKHEPLLISKEQNDNQK